MHGFSGPLVLGAAIGFTLAVTLTPAPVPPPAEPAPVPTVIERDSPVRLGVYDSRGVAIAWVRSEFNDLGEKMDAHRAAKAEGDEQKARTLERWGEMKQRELHFQGFGVYPVDAYLEPIRASLPALLSERELDAIVWRLEARTTRVATVDVTVDLMVLLGMDREEAARMRDGLRRAEPLDFAALYELDPRE